MKQSDISLEQFPLVVTEILMHLKVRDAMSVKIFTASKSDTLRNVQQLMREKKISGVPIVEGDRIIGMVSVDDIIKALDHGHIESPLEKYMSKKLVVLEDDMPLTFAVSYFEKYHYRRFPVVDMEQRLVGMLTSRDILSTLVNEMNKEIRELEDKIEHTRTVVTDQVYREYSIKKFNFESAGQASFEIKSILKDKDISQKVIRRAAIASYELEINIAIHSHGGKIIFSMDDKKMTITAQDEGPGIENVEMAVKEGYSTANDWVRTLGFGAGMGLPNVKKVSDEFDIQSVVGEGTTVQSVIFYN